MPTIPPSTTPPPADLPLRGDRTTFSIRVDSYVTWFSTCWAEIIALVTNCYNNAVEAYNNAAAALASANAASASAATAAATANAAMWISGHAYAQGECAISAVDFETYRRKTEGSGVIDPSSDSANWVSIVKSAVAKLVQGRNVVVNGDCSISQINGTTLITPVNGGYSLDNVHWVLSVASKLQAQQVTNVLNSLGATHAETVSVLSSYMPAASDSFFKDYPIEGINFARFFYGSANARPGSLQFKARALVAGTYSGAIQNYAQTRSFPFSFVLAANTDTIVKIENIPGDTGGVWVGPTNTGAARIVFDHGSGPNLKGAAGAWVGGNIVGVTGAVSLVSQANGSTLTITDVQFEESEFCTQFERKLKDQNLIESMRYYEQTWNEGTAPASGNYPGLIRGNSPISDPSSIQGFGFRVEKRTTPTLVFYNPVTGVSGQVYRENDASTIAVTGYQYTGNRGVGSIQIALPLNMSYLYHCAASARI